MDIDFFHCDTLFANKKKIHRRKLKLLASPGSFASSPIKQKCCNSRATDLIKCNEGMRSSIARESKKYRRNSLRLACRSLLKRKQQSAADFKAEIK